MEGADEFVVFVDPLLVAVLEAEPPVMVLVEGGPGRARAGAGTGAVAFHPATMVHIVHFVPLVRAPTQ